MRPSNLICWIIALGMAAAFPAAAARTGTTELGTSANSPTKRVLVLDPNASGGVDETTVRLVGGFLTVETAALGGLEVISSTDVAQMLNLEATKTNLGCSAESCMSEIADAMGTDLVIFGDLGRLGELYLLNLTLFESGAARSRGRVSLRTRSIESLPDALTEQLPILFAEVLPHLRESAAERKAVNAVLARKREEERAQANKNAAEASDMNARTLLLYSGVAVSAAGVVATSIGLIPTLQYELALQAAEAAIRDKDRDVYDDALKARNSAIRGDDTWGRITLWSGVGSLGVGVILWTVGALWPDPAGEE